jgi:hypothetical protein
MTERDVPLELESKLFVLPGSFVLCADEYVIEEEKMPEFTLTFGQLDNEGVLDEMSLGSFELRKQRFRVLDVVLVDKVLRRLIRLIQGCEVLAVFGSVFDQILKKITTHILKDVTR